MLQELLGTTDPEDGPDHVTYHSFESFWQRRSGSITDDGFFALVLHNHFPL